MQIKEIPKTFPIPNSMKSRDMTGMKFGLLKVVGLGEKSGRHHRWVCQCDCGFYTVTFGFSLRQGKAKSCGCVAADKSKARWMSGDAEELREKLSKNAANVSHRLSKHPMYRVWIDMRSRCYKPKNKFYKDYGGRGIRVCDKWLSFQKFFDDMAPEWGKGLQIGRIDNDGNYEPGNCRWETPTQQQRNKRNTTYIDTPDGVMKLADASDKYGISSHCLAYRIKSGWEMDAIFSKQSQRERMSK